MPELPEVETVRRGLAPTIEGRTIVRAEIVDPRLVRPHDPQTVARELEGERVEAVDRLGKYLIVRFSDGRVLLIHLRMTGSLRYGAAGTLPADAHARATLTLDDGTDVVYRDVRRFGTWDLFEPGEADAHLAERLGPEPLGRFTADDLGVRLARRTAPLKAALLDQRVVAGLGNIYVDEALWYARLHPLRPAGDLGPSELRSLHRSMRLALRRGIARQGATLRDYATPDGTRGAMQDEFRVYGREGEPCDRCRAAIVKSRVAGRGTWTCPLCQVPDPR